MGDGEVPAGTPVEKKQDVPHREDTAPIMSEIGNSGPAPVEAGSFEWDTGDDVAAVPPAPVAPTPSQLSVETVNPVVENPLLSGGMTPASDGLALEGDDAPVENNPVSDVPVPPVVDGGDLSLDESVDVASVPPVDGGVADPAADDSNARIGDRLISAGVITADQLNVALQEKKVSGRLLGEILVTLGFVTDEALSGFLAESTGFEVFDPKSTLFDSDALELIDKATAVKYQILPLSVDGDKAHVAMSDPYDVMAMDAVRRYLPKGMTLVPVVSTPTVLSNAIDKAYGYASSITGIMKELEEGSGQEIDLTELSDEASFSHPIVRLINALVFDAVKLGVSDLHFEPEENFVRLRYRKDGVLYTAQTLHKNHWSAMSQRLKIMSGMNIADKLSPQDGRFNMSVGGRVADFRVSALPTVNGENIVLRVLDQSESIMPMTGLGFSDHNLKLIRSSQSKPEGIIIVTGPTGSGKTTSLYSMLNEINDVEVNIQTLEDPVEYSLPMIRQTHVREGVLEFSDGIKALLRQDPDIIFIGEIRDAETANMALKASMTGHQVYTTLHTNDSFGAIPRLFDLGLKPGMVAGAIISVFAQRLVRVLCSECKDGYKPDEDDCAILGVDPKNPPEIFRPLKGGCQVCEGKGYKGRTAVVEILMFDEEMDELLADGRSKAELKAKAIEKGFKSMKDDGILKILKGITSLESLAKSVDIRK